MFKSELDYVEEQFFVAVSVNYNKNESFMVNVQKAFIKQLNHVSQGCNWQFQDRCQMLKKAQI